MTTTQTILAIYAYVAVQSFVCWPGTIHENPAQRTPLTVAFMSALAWPLAIPLAAFKRLPA
jgi:hypothetical protein